MGKLSREEKEVLKNFKMLRRFGLPKHYTLRIISLKDWLLVAISVIVSTSVALYPQSITNIIRNTFVTLLLIFAVLSVIDLVIYYSLQFRKLIYK